MRFELKDFQTEAVAKLFKQCRSARREALDGQPQAVLLSSPTGSGKTIILTDLMERLWRGFEGAMGDPHAAFLWLSDAPELNEQSRKKIEAASEVFPPSRLVTIEPSFDQQRLSPGHIYFLNTQKLGANSLLVKHGDRRTWTIWETIDNTIEARPESFYLILDEAHRGMRDSSRSRSAETRQENERLSIVQRFIKGYSTANEKNVPIRMRPTPIIVGLSATPERFSTVLAGAGRTERKVEVPWADVQLSGLIKDRIILDVAEDDQPGDWALLQHAAEKLMDYEKEWAKHCEASRIDPPIRPVLVVQLENGNAERLTNTDLSRVMDVLERSMIGLPAGAVAHCMEGDGDLTVGNHVIRKIEASRIAEESSVTVVLFKTALTTGWDCPRAEVMMSFRKAQDSTLIAQLVGRMVRTPLAKRIENNDVLGSVWLALPQYDEEGVREIVEKLHSGETGTPVQTESAKDLLTYRPDPDMAACLEALKKLPTYVVERPRRIVGTKRLMKLARRLNWNNIDKNAIGNAKKLIMDGLKEERDRLKRDPAFAEKVTGKAKITIREFVIEFGQWKEEYDSRTYNIEATPENIDDMFEQCYGILGEGINQLYVNTLFTSADDMIGKLELFCIVQNKGAFEAVDEACNQEVERLLREYADEIAALPPQERAKVDDVRRRGPDPAVEQMNPPENLQLRKESPKWEKHLYIDERGKFGWDANTWERDVLKEALADSNVVGWLRNVPRRAGSLCIPYGRGQKKPMFPDLLIFRRQRNKIVVDVLEPHGGFIDDSSEKAAGLAEFARKHGNHLGRIEFIRVANHRIARLKLHDAATREKVERVTDKEHLNDLFSGL